MSLPIPPDYQICPVTGYLEKTDGTGIQPKHLTAFLKHFRKSGDKTAAITFQGFRYSQLDWFFQHDAAFKADFKETLYAMKHGIEGLMFEQSQKPSGLRDRQKWLEINFPDEYGTKRIEKNKGRKNQIESLLSDLG